MIGDVYFPLWVNLLMPTNLLLMFAVNLGFNTLVVLAAWRFFRLPFSWPAPLRYVLFATLLGLVADFTALLGYEALRGPVAGADVVFAPAIILAAGILIFCFNYVLARAFSLRRREALILAVTLGIVTAPWTVLLL